MVVVVESHVVFRVLCIYREVALGKFPSKPLFFMASILVVSFSTSSNCVCVCVYVCVCVSASVVRSALVQKF